MGAETQMISLAHINGKASNPPSHSGKEEVDVRDLHSETHLQQKEHANRKSSAERATRPNSQFLSRLVGRLQKSNPVPPAPGQDADRDQDKHDVIADLKGKGCASSTYLLHL